MGRGITLIIPTLNGGPLFERSLAAMRGAAQIVVVDSGSTDGTVEAAKRQGAEVVSIDRRDFHHARTRNRALSSARHELVLFTVQDAVPYDSHWLEACAAALDDPSIAAACGRQIPHDDADLYARFSVERHHENLGARRRVYAGVAKGDFDAQLRSIQFDNVCAIYRRDVLAKIPFPDIPFGEDLAWSREAQRAGHRVAYDPRMRVRHSHNRPPEYDFRRSAAQLVHVARHLGCVPLDRGGFGLAEVEEYARHLRELEPVVAEARVPLKYRVARVVGLRALKGLYKKLRPARGGSLRDEAEAILWVLMSDVRRRYPGASRDGLLACARRLSAFERGRFVAQVFLSRERRGDVPVDLAAFVAPLLVGI